MLKQKKTTENIKQQTSHDNDEKYKKTTSNKRGPNTSKRSQRKQLKTTRKHNT